MSAPSSIQRFHSSRVRYLSPTSFPHIPSYRDAARSFLITKSNLPAISVSAADPPMRRQPESFGKSASSSFTDMGIERRYFPGTVFPDMTTLTSACGSLAPWRIMSIVTYSTLSAPASRAAPAMARIIGEMYGGTPSAAGSSM